ncbi:hypothetical protein AVEN_254779-1 [Araneus ventricosus]|uniref:Uncharacterized protein n=1 Tax=Araneus ventricosus TaxID=182803 RepID=A0A4Y2G9L0_ARAVE|nr:hypothetical protein AVEN_254779-1 [Araneus ventricosus]
MKPTISFKLPDGSDELIYSLRTRLAAVAIWNGTKDQGPISQVFWTISQVRRKRGSNDHPTPVYFLQMTRTLLAEGMFVMCGNANCESNDDIILESTQIIAQTDEDCLELVID